MGVVDSILVKYGAYNLGMSILSLPVFGPGKQTYLMKVGNDPALIARDYEQNSSLLVNLSQAVGKIIISYKKFQNLAGITSRVSRLYNIMEEIQILGRYERVIYNN